MKLEIYALSTHVFKKKEYQGQEVIGLCCDFTSGDKL
jgi:hypothetical protein